MLEVKMKTSIHSAVLVISCVALCGCVQPEDAKEITPEAFFALRMENNWRGKVQAGWFIVEDGEEFVVIGRTSAKFPSDEKTKWIAFRKCRRTSLTQKFPGYRELDGFRVRHLVWTEIEPIQKADVDAVVKQHGSGGMTQHLDWEARLTESNIVGEVIWDYTIRPSGEERHFDFVFELASRADATVSVRDKTSNKSIGHYK
jgi:hypothetical protein